MLNSDYFQSFFEKLQKAFQKDAKFKELVLEALGGREHTPANINFMLEELVLDHIIRLKLVEFPKTLVKDDTFRLMVYPGPALNVQGYIWKNKILPRKGLKNLVRYYNCAYDPKEKVLYNFDKFEGK